MILLAAAALLAVYSQIVDDNSLRPIPVAKVLADPGKYENRVVTLTGAIFSTPEVVSLQGEGCRNDGKNLVGRPWACAVLVNLPRCSETGFQCSKSTVEVIQAFDTMRDSRHAKQTFASMTGELRLSPTVDGRERGLGHLGAFRAVLIVVDAKLISKANAY